MTGDEDQLDGLPRDRVGNSPQRLILGLYGEYWFHRPEPLPSAALVTLVEDFGITAPSARVALGRLVKRGLLVHSKQGRNTFYGIAPIAERRLEEVLERILRFGTTHPAWDGNWTIVAFSVPEQRRDERHAARVRLRWLGFAPLYDGTWISPSADPATAADALVKIGIHTATVFTAQLATALADGDPLEAWDLDELRKDYAAFLEEFSPILARAQRGALAASDALVARTQLIDNWRHLSTIDPDLPPTLLPGNWPQHDARQLFELTYDTLGPLGEKRFRQVLVERYPELADRARHFTTTTAPAPDVSAHIARA